MSLKNLDQNLILAAQVGDRDALEQLLVLTQPDIRQYAKQHCVISDVDDAVQEVLIILARRLETLKILAAFSSWLFKTVQRECRRLGRITLNYDPFDETELEAWLHSKSKDELLYELVDAVDRLAPDYREVIILKDFQQFANREIATQMGISVAAVKSRLHRARSMVRSLLLNS